MLYTGWVVCEGAYSVYGDRQKGLWVFAGEGCGKKPAASFSQEAFCERPIAWNAAKKKFEYAPVPTVRMIQ